jgi:cytochrome subunit of sulfide dehydrogenase
MTRILRAACVLWSLVSAAAFGAADPKVVASCDACHGTNGVTKSQEAPSIAGVSSAVLTSSLKGYKAKSRPCPPVTIGATKGDMCTAAKDLDDAAIGQLADQYSKQPYQPLNQSTDAAKAAAGKAIFDKSCKKCHSSGKDPADDAGILAGQPMGWLKSNLDWFRKGQIEQPKKMKEVTSGLSDADIEALSNYLASAH